MYSCLFNYFFNSLLWYNEFTEVRQNPLHFDSIINPTHYESISVTWANGSIYLLKVNNRSTRTRWNRFSVNNKGIRMTPWPSSNIQNMFKCPHYTDAVIQRCSVKRVLLEILQNLQENTCARISFFIKLHCLGLQLY